MKMRFVHHSYFYDHVCKVLYFGNQCYSVSYCRNSLERTDLATGAAIVVCYVLYI